MTPHRRGILVTFLVVGLTLGVGLGIVLAAGASASPTSGSRDNGGGVQTGIVMTGDLVDDPDNSGFTLSTLHAYWDLPNPNSPNASYMMSENRGKAIANGGAFTISTRVPLKDANGNPVRPGTHVITVCANKVAASAGLPICESAKFKVLQGLASLNKSSGRQGSQLTISGSQWVPDAANESIRITWAPAGANQDVLLDNPSSSSWNYTIQVPFLPSGTYPVRICSVPVTGAECAPGDIVTKQFTILDPILTLNKNTGKTGEQFSYQGQIFFPNQVVKIFFGPKGSDFGDPGVHEIGPGGATTNADGNFGSFAYTPSEGPGEYTVTACTLSRGQCNSRDVDQKDYTITALPTPSPTKTPSPTTKPTASPTPSPTKAPTASPTPVPTASLTAAPTATAAPSATPSASPTPSLAPTVVPASAPPTDAPTAAPTTPPTDAPTEAPTDAPTPAPTPTPTAKPVVVTWPEHLHTPGQTASGTGIDLGTLGGMSLLALLIAFLVPFPGTLFNKTVEANYAEIMGGIAGLKRRWTSLVDAIAKGPLGPVRRGISRLLAGRFGVLIFLGMSALVYGFLSPTFGLDTMSLALFLGLLTGLAFITAAFDLPLRIYHGRTSKAHDRGVLRALWWTLLVAVICVVVSRLMNFQPGYLYGLIVSIVFVTEISRRDEGVGTWLAAIWLLILSFVAWILLAFVRQGEFDPWLALFLQTVLVTFVVAGIETLAVGLLPIKFLPGHPLYQWRRGAWFVVFAMAVMGYLLILVDPANGYLSDDSRTPMIIGIIFLVTFGIVSFGTWAYFRYRPARPSGDLPGEAPAA